nr:putative disease resistance protein RGA1 [Coffea arabica]
MESLEEWSDAMVPSNSSSSIKVFSNLWYLVIERLPSLAVLPGMENLTSLEELEIRRCGIVACIRNLNSLTSLESSSLEDCPALDASLDMKNPQSLHTLNISRCDKLNTSLSNNLEKFTLLERLTVFSDDPGCWAKGLQYLANLCELELGGFSDNLDYFPWPDSVTKDDDDSAKQHFFSLEKLELSGWPKITSLPDQIQHHSTLTVLEIQEFEGLEVLPEWIGSLQNLQEVCIGNCTNLKQLPSAEAIQQLTSLNLLYIADYPLLAERCTKGSGEKWPKIAFILDPGDSLCEAVAQNFKQANDCLFVELMSVMLQGQQPFLTKTDQSISMRTPELQLHSVICNQTTHFTMLRVLECPVVLE